MHSSVFVIVLFTVLDIAEGGSWWKILGLVIKDGFQQPAGLYLTDCAILHVPYQ